MANNDPGVTPELDLFEKSPIARWIAGPYDVKFPVQSIREQGGNRIVEHKRPFREGAKLDDTGGEPFIWTVTAVFNNTIDEDLGNSEPLYPNVLNRLIEALASVHETGNLHLPTRSAVRARPKTWDRTEDPESRDHATLVITFIEDNEDAVTRTALKEPAVAAQMNNLATQAAFTAASQGSFALADLQEAAENLQNLMQAPGRVIDDITRAAERVKNICKRTLQVLETENQRLSAFVSAPQRSELARQLYAIFDLASAAPYQKNAARGIPPRIYIVPGDTDIYTLASTLKIDPDVILDLNFIADPLYIRAGTKLRIPIGSGNAAAA